MDIYGKDFAAAYDEGWSYFSRQMWPVLLDEVKEANPEAQDWLDLCCGTGQLLKQITRHGYTGVGVDLSAHQLRRARRNAPAAKLVRADMRTFHLRQHFDMISCIFDSLNYLTQSADLLRVFRGVRRHLRPDGLFVFDVNTPYGHAQRWRGVWITRRPKWLLLTEGTAIPERHFAQLRVTGFIQQGKLWRRFEELHVQRGYDAAEIESSLTQAGFRFRAYDAEHMGRKRKKSERLLYVCRPR